MAWRPIRRRDAAFVDARVGVIKRHKEKTLDQARDRYAVGVGVGLLVLEERNRKLDEEGKERPVDTLAERVAVARAALALMPDFDKLVMEAGLESE